MNIDLVPVFLGAGRRYSTDGTWPLLLADPTTVVVSERVTHLGFPARR